ncbi:pyridoxamine 5'-phosphate oxidase family protein [Nocardia aurea]|uniref:Pyridoxamine 5'-phosphate oxidase family protein n=1 Tax=Nocardia aurea TaxID=2144174 RepID=A0ABV3FST1_9NOCA
MRPLRPAEIAELLADEVSAHLATVDESGYPHVTPVRFVWDGDCFRLTDVADRPHLRRMRSDPRVGFVVHREPGARNGGGHVSREIRVTGQARLTDDIGGSWTSRIREKYARASGGDGRCEETADRVLVTITPSRFCAVAVG